MTKNFDNLLQTIATLRAPGGCPWDRQQSLSDAARYLLDEAGELLDAALAGQADHVKEELADLLFMTCFCCQILGDSEDVTMDEIARLGNEKLIRRHPHVFGESAARDSGESQERWNAIKDQEKRERGIDPGEESALKDMPSSTAPLHQAHGYQQNAAEVGFDWPDIEGVWAKLREEWGELEEAVAANEQDAMTAELGDFLFAAVNLARWLNIPPDAALRQANRRFRQRFRSMETEFCRQDRKLQDASLKELERAWQQAKARLKES